MPPAPGFKASRFNIKVRDEAGSAFWYNTASGQRLFLSPEALVLVGHWLERPSELAEALQGLEPSELAEALQGLEPSAPLPEALPAPDPTALPSEARALARHLLEQGFLVPAGREELKEVLDRLRIERQDPSHLSLTLSLTSDCDLACPYCIVPTTRQQGALPPATEAALLRWWERQLVGRQTCSLEWLGGEPLLYPERLQVLATALLERARQAGVPVVEHTLITNGTRLTRDVAMALQRLGIRQVQVTLDGPPEVHDRCRPTRDGRGGSFERIVANLKEASPYVGIVLRVNLAPDNAHTYVPLLDRLQAEGLEHLALYPARVFAPDRAGCGATCTLTPEAFGALSVAFQLAAMERGFQPDTLPTPARGGYCGAYRTSYFVVDPDGFLYRCPARVGQARSSAIGSVFDLEPDPDRMEHQRFYDRLGPTREKGCLGCKILPVCLGGCPEEGRVSGQRKDECSPWRFRIRGQLVIEHERYKAFGLEA